MRFEEQLNIVLRTLLTEGRYELEGRRGEFNVEVNPLRSKFLTLARLESRGFVDTSGNVYLWDMRQAEHYEVEDMINRDHEMLGNPKRVKIAVPFTVETTGFNVEVSSRTSEGYSDLNRANAWKDSVVRSGASIPKKAQQNADDEKIVIRFSQFTDGTVPPRKYEATLRQTPQFMRMLKGIKYDPFAKSDTKTFGMSNPFDETYDDDDF